MFNVAGKMRDFNAELDKIQAETNLQNALYHQMMGAQQASSQTPMAGPLAGLLGQYQGGYSQDALRNAYAPPPSPKINGETFADWNTRYMARVEELEQAGMTWPWVEGQNWKKNIEAWASLYGSPA